MPQLGLARERRSPRSSASPSIVKGAFLDAQQSQPLGGCTAGPPGVVRMASVLPFSSRERPFSPRIPAAELRGQLDSFFSIHVRSRMHSL